MEEKANQLSRTYFPYTPKSSISVFITVVLLTSPFICASLLYSLPIIVLIFITLQYIDYSVLSYSIINPLITSLLLPIILTNLLLLACGYCVIKYASFAKGYVSLSLVISAIILFLYFLPIIGLFLAFLMTFPLALSVAVLNAVFIFPLVGARNNIVGNTKLIKRLFLLNLLTSAIIFAWIHSIIGGYIYSGFTNTIDSASFKQQQKEQVEKDQFVKSAVPTYFPPYVQSLHNEQSGDSLLPQYVRNYLCVNNTTMMMVNTIGDDNNPSYKELVENVNREKIEGVYPRRIYEENEVYVYRELNTIPQGGAIFVGGNFGPYTQVRAAWPSKNYKYTHTITADLSCFTGISYNEAKQADEDAISVAIREIEKIASSYPNPN